LDHAQARPCVRSRLGMFRSHPLESDFTLDVVAPQRPPSPEVEARVEAIWKDELRVQGDRLFNGPLLSLLRHTPQRLTVQRSEYRRFLAQLRQPELAASLGVQPLAVTGILTCRDGIVLGRRGNRVAQDPGRWEAAPAGSLDRPDPYAQLQDELYEEVGITADQLEACRAVGLIRDLETSVYDIVFDLRTSLTAVEVSAAHATAASDEYVDLAIVPADGLLAYIAEHRTEVAPALVPALRTAGFLPSS
ncbi:MAG: hypothetical protein LC799_16015, partial [Actinobacteria bacterium]|nr:hypothetical protein [Actinomycetota bacterium]